MSTSRWPLSAKKGFTLVELLVVIAIIGLLTAIAVPAVMMAMKNAQRTMCLNNLKELGRATISFDSSKRKYPSAFTTWQLNAAAPRQIHPWVVDLLPELDQQTLYDEIRNGYLSNPPTGLFAGTDNGYVAVLNCPSDPYAVRKGTELTYVANMGIQDAVSGTGPLDFRGTGIFYDRSDRGTDRGGVIEMTQTKIQDGAGQTLLFSENANLPRSGVFWNFSNGVTSVASSTGTCVYSPGDAESGHPEFAFGMVWRGTSPSVNPFSDGRNDVMQSMPDPWAYARPSSHHAQSFNVVFADGRVEKMSTSISYDIYCKLMTPDSAAAQRALGNPGAFGYGRVNEEMFAQ